jgi:beta-glucosidase
VPGVDISAALNVERYFDAGRALAPWAMTVSDAGGARRVEGVPVVSPAGAVSVRPVDLTAQEDGRQFIWTGNGTVAIAGPAADLGRQLNNAFALAIDWRIDTPPAGRVALSFGDKALHISEAVRSAPRGRAGMLQIPLRCFAGAGVDITKVGTPFSLMTDGAFGETIARVRLEPITSADACPPLLPG